jgi:hypothetical protein
LRNEGSINKKEIGAFKLVKVQVKKAKMKAKSVVLHPSLVLSAKDPTNTQKEHVKLFQSSLSD